jgi:hypothetical protein
MNNILNKLSPEAQYVLSGYSSCNIGILKYVQQLTAPSRIYDFLTFSICVYDKNAKFPTLRRGVGVTEYLSARPKSEDTYLVLVSGSGGDDAGELKGLLKKYGKDGFLYKPFNETTFQDNSTIKYDYTNKIVKLVEPYSFLKGGGRKW